MISTDYKNIFLLKKTQLDEVDIELYKFLEFWKSSKKETVVITSGSTGLSKKIKISKKQIENSAKSTISHFKIKEKSTFLICLPVKYIGGKMMLIRAIISKAKIILYKPSANPFIELNDNIDFIALTPLQLFNLAKNKKNFIKIKLAIIGGGEISNQLILELQNISTNCYQTYGMTETISHIAVRNLKNCNDKTPYKCLDNISIDTNQNNQLIINSEQLNLKNLLTNDIVEIINKREFIYLGRKDNIINSGGLKINPKMLENEIQKSLGSTNFYIDKIKNEKLGEEVVLIALLDLNIDSLIKSINTIKDKNTRPKKVFFTDKFFHNENQKLDRVKSKKYALNLNKSFSLAKK